MPHEVLKAPLECPIPGPIADDLAKLLLALSAPLPLTELVAQARSVVHVLASQQEDWSLVLLQSGRDSDASVLTRLKKADCQRLRLRPSCSDSDCPGQA